MKPEKVAVGSERQSGSFLEQDSTEVPKFTFCSFLPLRESCWGVTSPNPAMRLVLLKIPQYFFSDFSKIVPLHTLFFCYYPNTLPLSKSRYRGRKLQNHPSSQHLAAHGLSLIHISGGFRFYDAVTNDRALAVCSYLSIPQLMALSTNARSFVCLLYTSRCV